MWLLAILMLFSMSINVVLAQNEPKSIEPIEPIQAIKPVDNKTHKQLSHKIEMARQVLNSDSLSRRLADSNDEVANQLVDDARANLNGIEFYMDNAMYLEAGAIIDYVLRDLTASSQRLSAPSQKIKRYHSSLNKLESFVLPEWSKLSNTEKKQLQKTTSKMDVLIKEAKQKASVQSYDEAIKLLNSAYNLKHSLLKELPHENTVVYDLEFASEQDEYQYMIDRAYHFIELVNLALSQQEISLQTRALADSYVNHALINLEAAEDLKTEENYSEAISVLTKSINQFSSVLKLLGIKI